MDPKTLTVRGFCTAAGNQAHAPKAANHNASFQLTGGCRAGNISIADIEGDRSLLEAGETYEITIRKIAVETAPAPVK